MKNLQILVCPSASNRTLGYGWNYDFIGYGSSTTCTVYNQSSIASPAETIMIADAGNYVLYSPSRYNYVPSPGVTTFDYNYAGIRHNGGANLAFCDGHAKWLPENGYMYSTTLWDRN